MLPDGKTLMNINVGETDSEIIDQLVQMYQNSNLTYWNVNTLYHFGNDSYFDERHDHDGKKSLYYKIMETMNRFTIEETIPREMIKHIMLTGGALQLGS